MLLVLDTCLHACSAALYDETADRVVASEYQDLERGHAEVLGPMVQRLLTCAGTTPAQLSRIVVTRGPGTFTGLRIGLSFAKGMAMALDIPLLGLDSLTATAAAHLTSQTPLVVAHAAGATGLFYWARFEGTQEPVPALGTADDIAAASRDGELLVGGRLEARLFAPYAACLPVTDEAVQPLYLRPPDAKPSVPTAVASAHVRLARSHDIATLADIHAQCFTPAWNLGDVTEMLSIPGAGALVVELAGTIYGFVQFQWVAAEAEINTICVLPNYRRQHFGRDLMEGLLSQLTKMQTHKVFLEVADHNVQALGLYTAFGFQRNGVRKAYYRDGADAVTMVKALTP